MEVGRFREEEEVGLVEIKYYGSWFEKEFEECYGSDLLIVGCVEYVSVFIMVVRLVLLIVLLLLKLGVFWYWCGG